MRERSKSKRNVFNEKKREKDHEVPYICGLVPN